MDSQEKIIELLRKDRVSLYRELGRQEGVAEHGGKRHQHAETRPVQSGVGPEIGEPQDAFPDAYYAAHSWLNSHRKELQERLMVVFGHAKRESYPRGKEAELVTAISEAIGDVVGGNVAPVLVAAILFKEGLDGLWFGYRDLDDHVREMVDYFSSIGDDESALKILKRALEKNPESPEANYRCGSILDDLGRWTEAVEYFEKAIESNPTHHLALNALGFILIEYAVEPKKGFEYAKRALGMTWRGSWEEAGVLDTVGWAYYEQERDLVRAEKCLRRSVALTLPTEPYYITASYHLLAVLVEEGKVVEARGVFERILPVVPHNPIDKKCYREARRLMLQA